MRAIAGLMLLAGCLPSFERVDCFTDDDCRIGESCSSALLCVPAPPDAGEDGGARDTGVRDAEVGMDAEAPEDAGPPEGGVQDAEAESDAGPRDSGLPSAECSALRFFGGRFEPGGILAMPPPIGDELTIEAWVQREPKPPDATDQALDQILFAMDGFGGYDLSVFDFDDSFFVCNAICGCAPAQQPSPALVPEGPWTHVAATFDGMTISVHVNGIRVEPPNFTPCPELTPIGSPMWIGGDGTVQTLSGNLASLRITDRALYMTMQFTPAEVLTTVPGTVLLYRFDDGTATDLSTSGRHGVIEGLGFAATGPSCNGPLDREHAPDPDCHRLFHFDSPNRLTNECSRGPSSATYSGGAARYATSREGFDGALLLDATGSLSLGAIGAPRLPPEMTVEMLVRLEEVEATGFLYDDRTNGVTGTSIEVLTSTLTPTPKMSLRVRINDGAQEAEVRSLPDVLRSYAWHHVAVTIEDAKSEIHVFVDGIDVTDDSRPATWVRAEGEAMTVGAGITGRIDEVRVSDRVRY